MIWSTNTCSRAAVAPQTDGSTTFVATQAACRCAATASPELLSHHKLTVARKQTGATQPDSRCAATTPTGLLLHHRQTVAPQTDCCNANKLQLRCNSTTSLEHQFMLWSTTSNSGAPIHNLCHTNSRSGALEQKSRGMTKLAIRLQLYDGFQLLNIHTVLALSSGPIHSPSRNQ